MKYAVKFCGGCNPRYDRGKAFREIKEILSPERLEVISEGEECEYLIVFCGCSAACADCSQYKWTKEKIVITSIEEVEKLKERLGKSYGLEKVL